MNPILCVESRGHTSPQASGFYALKLLRRSIELLSHPIGELLPSGFSSLFPSRTLEVGAAEWVLLGQSILAQFRPSSVLPSTAPCHVFNHRYPEYSVKLFSLQCNFHLDLRNARA